ncbi:MAG: SDR family oxidoreductase [Pusillimonas sp.]
MDFQIKGKVALVTGAGGGLGSAIASSIGREGVKVVVADIDQEAAERVGELIRTNGGEALVLKWDLSDHACTQDRLRSIRAEFGDIDILVNNTGGPPPTPALGVAAEDWNRYFQSMVTSVIQLTNLVLPGMCERGWGRVITSTSSGVVAPIPNLAISNALRLSLVGWSKTLATEVASRGVTVNVILPGRIATKRIEQLDEARAEREQRTVEEVVRASTQSIPAGRYGRPHEYGDTVAFLASEAASYITGSVIRVDGGLIASI